MSEKFYLNVAGIMFLIQDDTTRVEQYDYRKATLNHQIGRFKATKGLAELLAKKAGKSLVENHTTWLIKLADGTTFAIGYHDGDFTLGVGGVTEGWY